MTILVGMIGSDGVVFAADELMVRQALLQRLQVPAHWPRVESRRMDRPGPRSAAQWKETPFCWTLSENFNQAIRLAIPSKFPTIREESSWDLKSIQRNRSLFGFADGGFVVG